MLYILHNPRCGKSREGLKILENSGKSFTVIDYLNKPLTIQEIKQIQEKLGGDIHPMIRKNESIWKENYKDKNLDEEQLILALSQHPKLIERPIVYNEKSAVIGRPPEEISTWLNLYII